MASSKSPARRPARHRAIVFLRDGERKFSASTLPALYRKVATEIVAISMEDVRERDREEMRELLAGAEWEKAVALYFEDNDREGMELTEVSSEAR
jgi:hypothetical protein